MRRFVAYVLSSFAILLGVGVAFKPVATNIKADLSYRDGKQITFKLYNREDPSEAITDEDASKDYAAIIDARLKSFGVTDYVINTVGIQTVKVTLSANNTTEYSNISKLLCVNPKIEFSTIKIDDTHKEVVVNDDSKQFSWHSSTASIEFDGNTSVLVMPIPEGAKSQINELYEQAKKNEEASKTSNDGEEAKKSICLWMNRDTEKDAYDKKDSDENVKAKIIYDEFNTSNFYYDTDKTSIQIKFAPTSTSTLAIQEAYQKALIHMNMWNASETVYDCKEVDIQDVDARVENLLIYGEHVHIAMSATFISFLIAFILITLVLAFIYKLAAIAIISTTTLTSFLTFLGFTLFKPAFGISAIVGLVIVTLASLFSGIAYNNYVHEEVYKGRSLKKANYEASKKTTLLTVDISVIAMVAGIVTYFVGGKTVSGLGIILIISSIINILINTFILKGLMWLITNNTAFQNKYSLFGINPTKIPNLSKEEKPFYDGPFEKKNYTKHKKAAGISIAVLTLASVVCLSIFAANQKIFNNSSYYASTNEIRFTINDDDKNPIPSIETFKTSFVDQIKNNGTTIKYDSTIENFNYSIYDSTTKTTHKYYTYAITINESDVTTLTYTYKDSTEANNLEETFRGAFKEEFGSAIIEDANLLKVSQNYNITNNVGLVFLSSAITSLAICLYFFIRRYRLSRVISTFSISILSSVISIGVLAMTRMFALPVASVTCLITTVFTLTLSLYFMHKDKDLIRDERVRDLDTRKRVLNRSYLMALAPASIFIVVSILCALNFFAFTNIAYSSLFFASLIGMLASSVFFMVLYPLVANKLDEKLMKVNMPEIHIKKHKTVVKKSNEPEEAIFIGIND